MHPVLGTMMPEICEAPHFSCQPPASYSNSWDAFITFSAGINMAKTKQEWLYQLRRCSSVNTLENLFIKTETVYQPVNVNHLIHPQTSG